MAGLGATHYNVRPDVRRKITRLIQNCGGVWNTYYNHPFPGWDDRSVDFWGNGGRGDPIPRKIGECLWDELMEKRDEWNIRHVIYEHRWWTDWEGLIRWQKGDHSGKLRHVHVTFY